MSNDNWFTLNKCLLLSNTTQMFLSQCRKKLAGGMTPSISWSLWAMLILILEWTANWQASSFLTMGFATWTARMSTPCQLSWCVICILHCFQDYRKANEAMIVVHSRIIHTWWKQWTFSDLRLASCPVSILITLRCSHRSTGGLWGYVRSLDLLKHRGSQNSQFFKEPEGSKKWNS